MKLEIERKQGSRRLGKKPILCDQKKTKYINFSIDFCWEMDKLDQFNKTRVMNYRDCVQCH